MIKTITTILLLALTFSTYSKTTDEVSMADLESFLGKIYLELKCDFEINFSESYSVKPKTCLRGIVFNLDNKQPNIIFYFDTHRNENKYLKNFNELSKSQRQKSMSELTRHIAVLTGILPWGNDHYMGIIHKINKSYVINNSINKDNKKLREFIIKNSLLAVFIYEEGVPIYLTYLTPDGKYVYKEGYNVQIED